NDANALQCCRDAVADLLEQCRQAELPVQLAPEIIRDYFQQASSDSDASQNFLSGGATVCRMVPMRQIPFKVICLLGLNEGQMPRSEAPGFIQRLSEEIKSPATRRYGDRSLRDDDRFLFLQLLSAADRVLYLSYCGKHPRDDSEQAPSSLISELLDCLAKMHPGQADFRKNFVVQHPLQVFSGSDQRDERSIRFDPAWQSVGRDTAKTDSCFIRTTAAELTADQSEQIVQWNDLKSFFKHPAKYFLQKQLGLYLKEPEEALDEHEPFGSPAGLQRYQLRHAVFDALIANDQIPSDAQLLAALRSQALLPAGFAAEPVLYKTLSEVKAQALRFKAWRSGEAQKLPFEIRLGRFVLQGSLDEVYPHGVARINFGEMQGRHHCAHGLDALLLSALNQDMPLVEFSELKKGQSQQRIRPTHASDEAAKQLAGMLELFAAGQAQALPFYPDAGFVYAKKTLPQAGRYDEKAWENASEVKPHQPVWWTTAMRGRDPFVDHADQPESFPESIAFREISLKVFTACAPELIGGMEGGDD
ncbi:MAG: hypothetical protein ACREO2_00435, partial [Arenimonas sp.]